MNISEAGLSLIKEFEGCRLAAYQDVRGIWTIGVGHTGPEVVAGLVWTTGQATAALIHDTQRVVDALNTLIHVKATQGQFDGCCCLAYNIGLGAFGGSTLLRLLNQGDTNGAMEQFPKWDMAGAQVVPGLLRRRLAEQRLFNTQG